MQVYDRAMEKEWVQKKVVLDHEVHLQTQIPAEDTCVHVTVFVHYKNEEN